MVRLALGLLLSVAPAAAWAQQFNDVAQQLEGGGRLRSSPSSAVPMRVQVAYQLQIPVDRTGADRTLSLDDQKAAVNTAHAAIFELVSYECDRLKGALGGDCHLIAINIGGGYGGGAASGASVPVSGSASFELTAPPSAVPPGKP